MAPWPISSTSRSTTTSTPSRLVPSSTTGTTRPGPDLPLRASMGPRVAVSMHGWGGTACPVTGSDRARQPGTFQQWLVSGQRGRVPSDPAVHLLRPQARGVCAQPDGASIPRVSSALARGPHGRHWHGPGDTRARPYGPRAVHTVGLTRGPAAVVQGPKGTPPQWLHQFSRPGGMPGFQPGYRPDPRGSWPVPNQGSGGFSLRR